MKTVEEIIEGHQIKQILERKVKKEIVALISAAMSEYAKEAVRELVTYGDDMKILKAWEHGGKIGTATDEDNLQKWMNTL